MATTAPTFPVRPSRAAFGPRYKNESDVVDPEEDLDAAVFDAMCFQVAGAGGAVPLAWVAISAAGALVQAWEAWDPDSAFEPTITHVGTGVYLVEYPALVLDANGLQAAVSFVGAKAQVQGLAARWACPLVNGNGHDVDLRTFALDGTTPTNLATFLEIW